MLFRMLRGKKKGVQITRNNGEIRPGIHRHLNPNLLGVPDDEIEKMVKEMSEAVERTHIKVEVYDRLRTHLIDRIHEEQVMNAVTMTEGFRKEEKIETLHNILLWMDQEEVNVKEEFDG